MLLRLSCCGVVFLFCVGCQSRQPWIPGSYYGYASDSQNGLRVSVTARPGGILGSEVSVRVSLTNETDELVALRRPSLVPESFSGGDCEVPLIIVRETTWRHGYGIGYFRHPWGGMTAFLGAPEPQCKPAAEACFRSYLQDFRFIKEHLEVVVIPPGCELAQESILRMPKPGWAIDWGMYYDGKAFGLGDYEYPVLWRSETRKLKLWEGCLYVAVPVGEPHGQ